MYTFIYRYACDIIRIHLYTCMHADMYIFSHICICMDTRIHLYKHRHVIRIYLYRYMQLCIYADISIHLQDTSFFFLNFFFKKNKG